MLNLPVGFLVGVFDGCIAGSFDVAAVGIELGLPLGLMGNFDGKDVGFVDGDGESRVVSSGVGLLVGFTVG